MKIRWDELTREEQQALERLARGSFLMLTTRMANRLKELGVAEQKLGGTGISRKGRELLFARRRRIG